MAVKDSTEISDAPDRDRYELSVEGQTVGFTEYRTRPGLIAFLHTEIDERFEGRGLGDTLIRFALEDARSRDLDVLPFCPSKPSSNATASSRRSSLRHIGSSSAYEPQTL
jgi:predicted GNAT family acetyltransferase